MLSPRGSALNSPRGGLGAVASPKAGGNAGFGPFSSLLTSPRAGSSSFPACLASPFLSVLAEFGAENDFDSSAETDWEAGSQVTDMADSCCSD
jgi:hypothetical protein